MHTSDFDYALPQDRIAQHPMEPRERAGMMVVDRDMQTIEHKHISDLPDYFRRGDLLVWNNSKVFKARLFGRLISANGDFLIEHPNPIELFLVRPTENVGVWQALARPGRHVRMGMRIAILRHDQQRIADGFVCDVLVKEKTGTLLVQFTCDADQVRALANEHGHVPLPPYVKDERHELEVYQTAYAKKEGSVAAPTAGFHLTSELIARIKEKGVEIVEVTLHVGLGTFLPVKTERIEDHTMHSEWVEVSEETAAAVNRAKAEGRRVIAIGTTTVRTLEGVAGPLSVVHPYHGDLNLFILPGFQFQIVDAILTNFHLPKSTLLMLVSAFAGDQDFLLHCYHEAVRNEYRFYSFGDAMLIV